MPFMEAKKQTLRRARLCSGRVGRRREVLLLFKSLNVSYDITREGVPRRLLHWVNWLTGILTALMVLPLPSLSRRLVLIYCCWQRKSGAGRIIRLDTLANRAITAVIIGSIHSVFINAKTFSKAKPATSNNKSFTWKCPPCANPLPSAPRFVSSRNIPNEEQLLYVTVIKSLDTRRLLLTSLGMGCRWSRVTSRRSWMNPRANRPSSQHSCYSPSF